MAKLVMAQCNTCKLAQGLGTRSRSLDMHTHNSSFRLLFSKMPCLMAHFLYINIGASFSRHRMIFLPDQHKLASDAPVRRHIERS